MRVGNAKETAGLLLSQYAEFNDVGTINYLLDLMAKKEDKRKQDILKEIGVSTRSLYKKDKKQKIIEEAFKRLDTKLVIEVLYGRMKTVFTNFVIDVLSIAYGEGSDEDVKRLAKEVFKENRKLLESVRDHDRTKIIKELSDE